MILERESIVFALNERQIIDFATRLDIKPQKKNAEKAIKSRKEGNHLYLQKKHTSGDHKMILHFYNQSTAYAPNKSEELMYSYSNRAYFLMHVNKYNEAIDNIDIAVELTDSTKMKLKLYCHKAKCLAALGSSMKDDVLREVDQIFNSSKLSKKDASCILNIIKKTKSAVASMKKFEPNDKEFLQEKERYNKIINDREKVDQFDFVEIKRTANMGRGLFAKTDFKAGDLVFVEKPCLMGPNFFDRYVYCSNCLAVAWTGIPCETCHEYIYCSLKCKNKAWEEHHRIECSITPYLSLCDPSINTFIHLSLKFILSFIKDNETIAEFKSKLKISNNEVEMVSGESDEKMSLFNKIMRLTHILPRQRSIMSVVFTVKALICMVKYTSLFSERPKNFEYKYLSDDDDVVFFGSLLLRLVNIEGVNVHDISYFIDESSSKLPYADIVDEKYYKSRGICMGLISSLTNNSCAPNIRRCFSDDMKYVFYAIEPIEKGTQLLDSYNDCFYESSLMDRIERRKNFFCRCIACVEEWPPVLLAKDEFLEHKMKFEAVTFLTEINFLKRITPLLKKAIDERYKVDKDLLQAMADQMNEIVHLLPQPSLARCMLLQVFDEVLEKYHGYIMPFQDHCSTFVLS